MKSIRIKLFLVFSLLLISFLFSFILINVFFVEEYYIYRTEKFLYRNYKYIENEYLINEIELKGLLINADRRKGIHSYVLSSDYKLIFNSIDNHEDVNKKIENDENNIKKAPEHIINIIRKNTEKLNHGYVYDVFQPFDEGLEDIVFINKLNTGEIIILFKPLTLIRENARVLNDFIILNGIIFIILGSIIVFFFSKKITKPIIDLSNVAKDISELDFSKKYVYKPQDEIKVLSDSINLISEKLDKSMKDLVTANKKLKKDVELKEEIDSMRKDFISGVSHELKTFIGVIKGYIEALKYCFIDDEEKRNKYFNRIISETDKMNKMVKELLDLAIMESSSYQLEKSVFNISVLINDVIEKFTPDLVDKGIDFKISINEDYFVEADYFKIEQVVSNYITNAINHVNENMYIEIGAICMEEKIKIFVFNTGKNILEKDKENIWDSFYKADKARSRKYGGSGIGLAIVKSIMNHHKSSYGVNNKTDGVEFWFKLKLI